MLYQTVDEMKSKNHTWVSWLKMEGISLDYSLYPIYQRFYWQSWENGKSNTLMVKPRKLKRETRSIFFIINLQVRSVLSYYHSWIILKNHDFFSVLGDNLFTVNQTEIFNTSELMRDQTWQTSFSASWVNEHNELVSVVLSAYKIKFLTVCISFDLKRLTRSIVVF